MAFNKRIVSFHFSEGGNATGIGVNYLQKLDAAGKRIGIKAVDTYGICAEVLTLADQSGIDHLTIYRRNEYNGYNFTVPRFQGVDYGGTPEQAAQEHWQAFKDRIPPEFDKRTWIEPVNEVDKNRFVYLGAFCLAYARMANAEGYKVCMLGMSSGEPEPAHWRVPEMVAYLRYCAENRDMAAVSLHEYSYTLDLETGSPYNVGRTTQLLDACDELLIPYPRVFLTEFGWEYNNVPGSIEAMKDIDWLLDLYKDTEQPEFAAIWNLGSGSSWPDIAGRTQPLIKPLGEKMSVYNQPAPTRLGPDGSSTPPPTTGCRGAPREQYTRVVNVLADNTTAARAREIWDIAWKLGKQTVTGSYDDGGIGDLNVRQVVLWDVPVVRRTEFRDWFTQNYPGVQVSFAGIESPPSVFKFEYWPTEYKFITQPFAANPQNYAAYGLPGHEGIDIRAYHGTKVFAVADGTVSDVHSVAGSHNYGVFVRVAHVDGFEITYAHLMSVSVSVGDFVKAGSILGLADNTGNSNGDHLHITLKRIGYYYPAPPNNLGLTYWPYNIHDPSPYLLLSLPIPTSPPPPVQQKSLMGLHASADTGNLYGGEAEFAEFRTLKPGVIKVLSAHSDTSIKRLASESPAAHFIVRAFLHFGNRQISPTQFVNDTVADIKRAIDNIPPSGRNVYVEVHNEPNLSQEGWTYGWQDGLSFAQWAVECVNRYKATLPSYVKYLYPGLSPGGDVANVRKNHWDFFNQGKAYLTSFDAVAVHTYWSRVYPMALAVDTVRWFTEQTTKTIWVTEASINDRPAVVTADTYAAEYKQFVSEMGKLQVAGVTFFVASASNPYFNPECWIINGQSRGIANKISNG